MVLIFIMTYFVKVSSFSWKCNLKMETSLKKPVKIQQNGNFIKFNINSLLKFKGEFFLKVSSLAERLQDSESDTSLLYFGRYSLIECF